jgi:hypothetical protein
MPIPRIALLRFRSQRTLFIPIAVVSLFLTACGEKVEPSPAASPDSKLTRPEADRLILAKHTFPSQGQTTVASLSCEHLCFNQTANPCTRAIFASTPDVVALENLGLVTVAFDGDTSRLALTEKGRKYVVSEAERYPVTIGNMRSVDLRVGVLATTLEFGAITGITQDDGATSATVEYTILSKPTPFGEHPVPSYNPRCTIETHSEAASFTKYDDGWRLTGGR